MEIIKTIIATFLVSFFSYASTSVVIVGDSLSAGYGVSKEQSYPQLAKKMLKEKGHEIKVLNGSVSGSTTSSLMSRLKWYKQSNPDVTIIALGANDGLRGIPIKVIKKNLDKGIAFAKTMSKKVVLLGMMLPLNYGEDYRKQFEQTYKDLSKKHSIDLMPFLLKDVAGVKKYNQEDGIHPNKEGHKVMAKNFSALLSGILDVKSK